MAAIVLVQLQMKFLISALVRWLALEVKLCHRSSNGNNASELVLVYLVPRIRKIVSTTEGSTEVNVI